jgi:hypothetical protein
VAKGSDGGVRTVGGFSGKLRTRCAGGMRIPFQSGAKKTGLTKLQDAAGFLIREFCEFRHPVNPVLIGVIHLKKLL